MSDQGAQKKPGLHSSPPPARPRQEPSAAGRGPQDDQDALQSTGGAEVDSADDTAAARMGELEDQRLRALADLDNARKKCADQISRTETDTRARVARLWLPVVDNLERALSHADADPASIVAGVQTVHDQAMSVLEQLGFARRDDLGSRFDPALHEAVAARADPSAAAGSVVGVIRPGYGDKDSQLRPAQVIVARSE
jgi:molecular chaperone GrpE